MQLRFFASLLGGLLVVCGVANGAQVCPSGYATAKHTMHFDYDTSTGTASEITATNKSFNTGVFVPLEIDSCPSGYSQYQAPGDVLYPLMEDNAPCAAGYYPAGGTCKQYGRGSCAADRYNSGIADTIFTPTTDSGSCVSGYQLFSRSDDYVYPMIPSTTVCSGGQYPGGGTCKSYAQSTCPSNYYKYSLNGNTFVGQANGECPSNYTTYAAMSNCDISSDNTCVDIATVINLLWYDGLSAEPTESTCTYNQPIVLPTDPVRPGFKFMGWQVRATEIVTE